MASIALEKGNVNINANLAASQIFFGKRSGIELVVEPRGGRYLKDLVLLGDNQKTGPVVGTNSFVCTLGGNRFLFKLDSKEIGVFDNTVKGDQVSLANGPFGKAPTTGIFLVHRDFIIVGYILDSDPTKYVVSQIKTGGTNVAYGEESGKNGFVMATSEAGFATLMSNKSGDWVFFVPVDGAPRSARVTGKAGDAPVLSLKNDGKFELSNGTETIFAGQFVSQMPSIQKQLSRKRVLKESGNDTDAGVVAGSRMVGFQKKGVIIFSQEDNKMATGNATSNFSKEEVLLFGAGTDSTLAYLLITEVGPTGIEVPRTAGDSSKATLQDLRFGRDGDAMQGFLVDGERVFWATGNNMALQFNGFSAGSKNGMTFNLSEGGDIRSENGVVYVGNTPVLQLFGVPQSLNITDIVEAP